MPEFTEEMRKELLNKQYGLAGSHSAVQICAWTRKSLRGKGSCYKQKKLMQWGQMSDLGTNQILLEVYKALDKFNEKVSIDILLAKGIYRRKLKERIEILEATDL